MDGSSGGSGNSDVVFPQAASEMTVIKTNKMINSFFMLLPLFVFVLSNEMFDRCALNQLLGASVKPSG